MKTLIVEDDFTCRKLLQAYLREYGPCDFAGNGHEALEAFDAACRQGEPYDLILLDIMMPEMDGHQTLKEIRRREAQHGVIGFNGVKVIMTTALDDRENIMSAFRDGCESYVVKPVVQEILLNEIRGLDLIET